MPDTPENPPPAGFRAVFAQPAFRTLWIAQFVSVFGDFVAIFGVVSRITFGLHGNASDVTLALRYGIFFPNRAAFANHDVRQFLFAGVTFAF